VRFNFYDLLPAIAFPVRCPGYARAAGAEFESAIIQTAGNKGFVMDNGHKQRMLKFLGVGLLNTAFGYGIYAALVFIELPYLIALFLATVAGVIFNYFSIGRIVFKARGGWLAFGKFIAAYVVVYIVNAALLSLLTVNFNLSPYLGQMLCIPPNVAMSWLLMNCWVYKNG
jgi:putative flippase GtrA